MVIRVDMLLPAIETHTVLIAVVPAAALAAVAGDDIDGAAWGIVDGEIGGGLAVNVDGAGVVEELMGAIWVALLLLKLRVELADGNQFYV